MHDLLEKLEALIEKWENKPYTGDYTKAAYSVCAKELRRIIGTRPIVSKGKWIQDTSSNDAALQRGYFEDDAPF